jgi:hypothetical protein
MLAVPRERRGIVPPLYPSCPGVRPTGLDSRARSLTFSGAPRTASDPGSFRLLTARLPTAARVRWDAIDGHRNGKAVLIHVVACDLFIRNG